MAVNIKFILLCMFLAVQIPEHNAQTLKCGSASYPYYVDLSVARSENDSGDATSEAFLVRPKSGEQLNCHGAVTGWRFNWQVSGFVNNVSCHSVMFKVWRPDASGPNSYTVVGETLFQPNTTMCEPYVPETTTEAVEPTTVNTIVTTDVPTTINTIVTTDDRITFSEAWTDGTMTDFTDNITDFTDNITDNTEIYTTDPDTTTVPDTTSTYPDTTTVPDTTTTYSDTTTEYITTVTPYNWPESVEVELRLLPGDHIPVLPGDVFGWVDIGATSTERRIPFESVLSGSGAYDSVSVLTSSAGCDYSVAATCDWSVAPVDIREYAVNMLLDIRPDPIIINLPTSLQFLEEEEVTRVTLFTVRATNDFSFGTVVLPDLTYSILSDTCGGFIIGPQNGTVTSTLPLDYEVYGGSPCNVTVQVNEGPYLSQPQSLLIQLRDINEAHSLDLDPATVTVDVTDPSSLINFKTIEISDSDDPNNWPLKEFLLISCTPSSILFNITSDTDAAGESFATVGIFSDRWTDLLYWQTPTEFTLQITAHDTYHSAGPLPLTVKLINMREPPFLSLNVSVVHMPEDKNNPADIISTIICESRPVGRTDVILYKLVAIHPTSEPQDIFLVNETTGAVTYKFNPGFDYFKQREFVVEVLCFYEAGPLQESTTANITVNIEHVNQAPVFPNPKEFLNVRIPEDAPLGTALPGVKLSATDRDRFLDIYDNITYLLDGGSGFFDADDSTGEILVTHPMNQPPNILLPPNMDHYEFSNISVIAMDEFPAFDIARLQVFVIDVNDQQPEFDQPQYFGSVKASTAGPQDSGITVYITDNDGPSNSDIYFIIDDPVASLYFEVVEDPMPPPGYAAKATIYAKQHILYEDYPEMTFTLVATDQGSPPLNNTADITIIVTEKNLYPPEFIPSHDSLDLRSDTPVTSQIYQLVATDNDSVGVNVRFEYFLRTIEDYFELDMLSGDVSITRELVAYRKHLLYMYAEDNPPYGMGPSLISTKPFSLRIDTYEAKDVLVDIYLDIDMNAFLSTEDSFLAALNMAVYGWDVRIESIRHDSNGNTIVCVYVVESDLPDEDGNQHLEKKFISEDKLLKKLRTNLRGTPNDQLKGPDFSTWQPYKVVPRYPNWIIDTPGGVAFLTILCALLLTGIILMLVLLPKKYGWCCCLNRKTNSTFCKKKRPASPRNKIDPDRGDHFKLNYLDPKDLQEKTAYTNYNKAPISNVFIPPPVTSPFNADGPQSRQGAKTTTNHGSTPRALLEDNDTDVYGLPPVAEGHWSRPPPRQRGGQAA